ncbi:MAG: polyprenyl synthetase family protein [Deltaproteobacteria bacterium]|nr:polyprenyl synthetase family protein [Deltaproteobacteria bacterium]
MKLNIMARIRPDLERIEAEINRLLTSSVPLISIVGRHIMSSGGKRLRPLLMILSARLCGYRGNHDASLAVVFEFLHAATLLHDDVVDHAEFRRNQPAANTIWGNPAVVLVGDFLYAKSILMTVGYSNVRILEVLMEATTRMAEGEVLQLVHKDNLEIDELEYLDVIDRKTAGLISAACQVGALLGGVEKEEEMALRDFGHHLGIAFQLIDDTLDYTGDVKELGKPVGNDVQEGKATLPLIFALRNGSAREKKRVMEIFSSERIPHGVFMELKELVTRSGGIEYTRRLATEHVEKAKAALALFPANGARQILEDIAEYVIHRRV